MMTGPSRKGPVTHRLMVLMLSGVFALLFYWLLGFVIKDIGSWPGPDLVELEKQLLDPQLVQEAESLDSQLEETNRKIRETEDRQKLLKDSIDNAKRTMDQLLEIQRLSLEKSSELSPAEQAAMSENIQLFLANQQQYQGYNDEISDLNEQLIELQRQQRENQQRLEAAREPIWEEHRARWERHNLRLASLKLAVLVPLLLVVLVVFLRKRGSIYTPLIYAAAVAVAIKVMLVMHEHFPTRYFKYILILVSLGIVTWILVHLLRMIAFPKKDWLLRQYRDAYEAFFCPICSFPIRRGPLKYLSWTRRSIRKVSSQLPATEPADREEAYTCPACGTRLYEVCTSCKAIRHSLLPACEKCGAEGPVIVEPSDGGPSPSVP
jgi:predicted RNA-binding Zn-ribbon protein involved in translation (DUF1610 family)